MENPPTANAWDAEGGRIDNPCFPRSGHGVLRRALRAYFGDGFRCLDVTNGGSKQPAHLWKTHDFFLTTAVRPGGRYLVQVRFPVPSLISWFLLDERSQGSPSGASLRLKAFFLHRVFSHRTPAVYFGFYPKGKSDWIRVARIRMNFWIAFYRKWILSPVPNRLVVDYDRLIACPERTLEGVFAWISNRPVDRGRVSEICREIGIRSRNRPEEFRYFDPVFVGSLSETLRGLPGVDVENQRLSLSAVLKAEELA